MKYRKRDYMLVCNQLCMPEKYPDIQIVNIVSTLEVAILEKQKDDETELEYIQVRKVEALNIKRLCFYYHQIPFKYNGKKFVCLIFI